MPPSHLIHLFRFVRVLPAYRAAFADAIRPRLLRFVFRRFHDSISLSLMPIATPQMPPCRDALFLLPPRCRCRVLRDTRRLPITFRYFPMPPTRLIFLMFDADAQIRGSRDTVPAINAEAPPARQARQYNVKAAASEPRTPDTRDAAACCPPPLFHRRFVRCSSMLFARLPRCLIMSPPRDARCLPTSPMSLVV